MIDERHEELASLYALDLLEGAELVQFESALVRQPELQSLVAELRATSASLAYTAPAAQPPAELKQRVLRSISSPTAGTGRPNNVIRPRAFRVWNVIPWAAAASAVFAAAWFGQRYVSAQAEADALRTLREMSAITIKTAHQQLEAERILSGRRLQNAAQQLSGANTQLTEARDQLTSRDRLLAEARQQLADRERQIAETRSLLGEREKQVGTLSERIQALASSSADLSRQLGAAKQQIARLTDEMKQQIDLADLKITALASMLKNSPQALAVAVWDPKKQEGLLNVQNLPALGVNEDYQLWIVDPQYPNPVDGGVFRVDPATGTLRTPFKAKQPVSAVNAFAVTRERKGGVPKAEGPFVLLGK